MNILLINHYAGSPLYGMEYRPHYLSREWVRLGHSVTVVGASFSHLRSQNPSQTEEQLDGVNYLWLKTPAYQGNGLGRIRNMLAFLSRLYRSAARLQATAPDVVIASSTYPLDIFPAASIARRAKARLVYEVHDLWPLSPIELGGMSPWHPFIMVMQRAENFAYRRAHVVASLLPKAEAHMREHGMAPEKFFFLPNGLDASEWNQATLTIPESVSRQLQQLKEQGRFLVGYAGSHGVSNALDTFISAASHLPPESVALVLVGQGPERSRLIDMADRAGLKNVIFVQAVPKGAIPDLLSRFDALYLGWQHQPLYRFGVSPNKLLDYMMSGRPVVHSIKAGNDLVQESECGISVAPEDPIAVASAIERLMALPLSERQRLGENGRRYALAHHDYRVLAKAFLERMTRASVAE